MGPVDTQHDAQLHFSTYPLALEDLLILARCPVHSGSIFAELDFGLCIMRYIQLWPWLPVITGYKWDYTFYKWGFVSTYN